MHYFLIAGEASGDLHTSNLMAGLKEEDPAAEFSFIGGDRMTAVAGKQPLEHFRSMNFMGLFEVLGHLQTLRKVMQRAKASIRLGVPDVVILTDYAGFNLRMAKYASKQGIPVFYYISPKVWAWRKGRIRALKRYVDRLFVIFPFEPAYFRSNGMEVEYHGNPLTDIFEAFGEVQLTRGEFLKSAQLSDRPIVALLAGSRKQEIRACLPEMAEAARSFPEVQFVVAGAPSVDPAVYEDILKESGIVVVYDNTYQLLSHADAAIVTSGTATLETALFNVPQVVIYKTGEITYRIAKLFVTFRFFSLVNLIYGDALVRELLQHDLVKGMRDELHRILEDTDYRLKMKAGYAKIREMIGEAGASRRVARRMTELLR
jgi:lipid-A-disaccharide synthase